MSEDLKTKGKYTGKWNALVFSPERIDLITRIMLAIQREARAKGLPDSYFQMSKLIQACGVPVGKTYVYSQLNKDNNYPFPLEALIAICKGYGIPLSVIFNPELFTDSPEL